MLKKYVDLEGTSYILQNIRNTLEYSTGSIPKDSIRGLFNKHDVPEEDPTEPSPEDSLIEVEVEFRDLRPTDRTGVTIGYEKIS